MRVASENQPTDPKLWEKAKAKAKKSYKIWPSAYAVGHALKIYKEEGGGWKKAKTAADDYEMPRKFSRAHCESKTCEEMGFSEKASCRPYKNCYRTASEYFMRHRPDENGPAAHDLASGSYMPAKVLTHPNFYTGFKSKVFEFWHDIRKVQGQPNALITIYRALPSSAPAVFNRGDWVTLSRSYAKGHIESNVPDGKVISAKVPAKDVRFAGDDLMEWGYWGQPIVIKTRARKTNRVARGKAKKDVGHGGLDEWFSGHGGDEGEATWGDWVAISPVKKTLESGKKVVPGDIVGPCGVSKDPDWAEVTNKGKDPLKCMPRPKAHDMKKSERAELAKAKQKAEKQDSNRGKAPTNTRTFEKTSASRVANRYFQAALIGDPKQLLEAYEGRMEYQERDALVAQALQNYIEANIEKRESELANAYSRLKVELNPSTNLWLNLTDEWSATASFRSSDRSKSGYSRARSLAYGYSAGFDMLREHAQPLFWAILQQLSLPANLTKKVQAASKYWMKSRLNAPRRDKRSWTQGFPGIEYPDAYLAQMSVWREHLALARECLAKGALHGEGTKSKVQAGPFTIVNTGAFPDEVMENVKQAVLKAAKALTKVGLGKVCYGDILVSKQIAARSNVLAFYILNSDEMFVRADVEATHNIVKTICHELAHRLEHKFMGGSNLAINSLYNTIKRYDGVQMSSLSGWPEIGRKIKYKKLDLVVTKVDKIANKIKFEQPPAPGLIHRKAYMTNLQWWIKNIDVGAKIEKGPDFNGFITPYAKKGGPSENFAEMVAYYALGELPAALVALLKPVLAMA